MLGISSAYQSKSEPSSLNDPENMPTEAKHPFRKENVIQMIRKHVTLYLADLISKDLETIISKVGGGGGI